MEKRRAAANVFMEQNIAQQREAEHAPMAEAPAPLPATLVAGAPMPQAP
ncbi:MAG: hypothetical protein HC875_26500, partial [Anaerolineales bacterium]|nr:hypothetical protein [Anaerolineales bacterium]